MTRFKIKYETPTLKESIKNKLPMSHRAYAVALCLAACALAAQTQYNPNASLHSPQCSDKKLCQWIGPAYNYQDGLVIDTYLVDGKELKIQTKINERYEAWCSPGLDISYLWPRYLRLTSFTTVKLNHCSLPGYASYAGELKKLNIGVFKNLHLIDIPSGVSVSERSFSGLEFLKLLEMKSHEGVIVLKPEALDALKELLSLHLYRVRAKRLPPNLDHLYLFDTGMKVLPAEAYNVTKLEIIEMQLKSFHGSVPRLKSLWLDTPKLTYLALHDATPDLILAGPGRSCRELETLRIRRARAVAIPEDFLNGDPTHLKKFMYTNGNITTLPKGLFGNTKLVEYVDVSENMLESLPSEVFSELKFLRELRLVGNRLTAKDLGAVQSLAAVTTLDLSGNPLGDLCPSGNTTALSSLHQLQELSLADTRIPRVCSTWLLELTALQHLNLSSNAVKNISCSDFRASRSEEANITLVDLTDNTLETFDCSLNDSQSGVDIQKLKQVHLLTDSECACECSFVKCYRKDLAALIKPVVSGNNEEKYTLFTSLQSYMDRNANTFTFTEAFSRIEKRLNALEKRMDKLEFHHCLHNKIEQQFGNK